MAVPDNVLQSLHTMDGYDQMLAMDKIAREQGVGVEQLQAELQAFIQRGATPIPGVPAPQENDMDGFLIPGEAAGQSGKSDQQLVTTSPRYIDDPSTLRMRYDPSVEGGERQSGITQAILCSTCSAPLGIPSTRPIKVTCPNCATESLFEN
jgi:hypothetical protein